MSPLERDYDNPAFDCNGEVDAFLSKMTLEEQMAFMERAFGPESHKLAPATDALEMERERAKVRPSGGMSEDDGVGHANPNSSSRRS